jgi:hypothetical protein
MRSFGVDGKKGEGSFKLGTVRRHGGIQFFRFLESSLWR